MDLEPEDHLEVGDRHLRRLPARPERAAGAGRREAVPAPIARVEEDEGDDVEREHHDEARIVR